MPVWEGINSVELGGPSPANKQAAKIVESAAPAAFSAQTGIYVANRKVKQLPGPAADAGTGQQLVALLDGLLKKHNTEARHP